MDQSLTVIREKISAYESPQKSALSFRYPILQKPIVFFRRTLRSLKNYLTLGFGLQKRTFYENVVARHSSILLRKLGESDMRFQENKVTNLKIAIEKINGKVIPPGGTFSLWHELGRTTTKRGYVSGMLLSNGKVSEGVGGGLCQLSNFLFWIFLHTDTKILERHHHSVDAFPDSGRTLPFGSGATIFRNYLDLRIQNISDQPFQIKLWLTETCLKGQILSDRPQEKKFHVLEKNHCFVKKGEKFFRFNELFRETRIRGWLEKEEKIVTNFAPVIYFLDQEKLRREGYFFLEEMS